MNEIEVKIKHENDSIYEQIKSVFNNAKSRSIYYILISYNIITAVIDNMWQYQMSLIFITTAAYTAATSDVFIYGAITSIVVSCIVAPLLNKSLSRQTLG
ncbi:MAG: hypothetical protein VX335_04615, partial [Pseudomonadota bacterium]|nr:hypothetical protein [Pseudomonadota bacterium]